MVWVARKVVIGLEGSERTVGFFRQAEASDFEWFKAIDGRSGYVPDYFDIDGFTARFNRPPYGGEIGCAASHYEVIKSFADGEGDSSDWMIVAEDDARFTSDFSKIWKRCLPKGTSPMLVSFAAGFSLPGKRHLGCMSQKLCSVSLFSKIVGWAGAYPYVCGYVYGELWGAGLYAINRVAARNYVALVGKHGIQWQADSYHLWASPCDIRVLLVRPSLAAWEGETSIDISHAPDEDSLQYKGIKDRVKRSIALRSRVGLIPRIVKCTLRDFKSR